jgi:hypothetical protein
MLREETKRLAALPAPGFAPQTAISAADYILLESTAPTNSVAVAVLKLRIAGAAGTQDDMDRICSHSALIKKSLHKYAGFPKKRFSPERDFCAPHAALLPGVRNDSIPGPYAGATGQSRTPL